jgi:phosphohistidine phosphatase
MTRTLVLLRHAKSSWDDPSLADHDRPLSKRGLKTAAAMGALIKAEKIRPGLVYVSSARRTLETLAGVEQSEAWPRRPEIVVEPELYHATPSQIFTLLQRVRDTERVIMLIGHNPGLQEFAVQLAGAGEETLVGELAESFPTGALAEFGIDEPWPKIAAGSGKLLRLVKPRELKKKAGAA